MKKENKKALITALIVSLILLVVAVAGTLVFDHYVDSIQFDTVGLLCGHVLGFLLMFAIVYHYEKKDDSDDAAKGQNHNIY